jgi:hypothetical protein
MREGVVREGYERRGRMTCKKICDKDMGEGAAREEHK